MMFKSQHQREQGVFETKVNDVLSNRGCWCSALACVMRITWGTGIGWWKRCIVRKLLFVEDKGEIVYQLRRCFAFVSTIWVELLSTIAVLSNSIAILADFDVSMETHIHILSSLPSHVPHVFLLPPFVTVGDDVDKMCVGNATTDDTSRV